MSLIMDLLAMATEIEIAYREKQEKLNSSLDSYVLSKLQNAKAKVEFFKKSIPALSNDPTLEQEILRNYQKDKQEILDEINNINIDA